MTRGNGCRPAEETPSPTTIAEARRLVEANPRLLDTVLCLFVSLVNFCETRGKNWRAAGVLECEREVFDKYAHSRIRHGGGKRAKVYRAAAIEDVRIRHEAVPNTPWLNVTAAVARRITAEYNEPFKNVVRNVRYYTRAEQW